MFYIDYKSGFPIYEQIYRSVVSMAAAGAFQPTEPLPSVRSVAQELGVNPNTVQKAYALLERDGVIHSLPGKGSFLSDSGSAVLKKQESALKQLETAVRETLESGILPQEVVQRVTDFTVRLERSGSHD